MKTPYPHLFSPLQIRGLMLKNRIIAAPMGIIPSHKNHLERQLWRDERA